MAQPSAPKLPTAGKPEAWVPNITFGDIDLSRFTILMTRVFEAARISLFASKDMVRAYMLIEDDLRDVSWERIEQACLAAKLKLDDVARMRINEYLGRLCQIDGEPCAVLIREGRPAKHGLDAVCTWHVTQPESYGAGKEADGGKVDYRERQSFIHVKKDQHILSVTPPTRGEPGQDIFGNELPAADGLWERPLVGNNIKAPANMQEMYAEIEGVVEYDGNRVHVRPMLAVHNVDFNTGNLRYDGDVQVGGSVCEGFEVESKGMVAVVDAVTGAKIRGKSVTVQGRTVGSEIIAAEFIQVHLVENTTLRANGSVTILDNAVNLTVHCGGRLVMADKKLSGGTVNCLGGLEVGWLGGQMGEGTKVLVREDTCALPALDQVNAELLDIREKMKKLDVALEPIRTNKTPNAMSKLPPKQREALKKLMDTYGQLEFEFDVKKSERKRLIQPILAQLRPTVLVSKGISAGVKITLGQAQWTCPEKLEGMYKVTLSHDGTFVMADPVG